MYADLDDAGRVNRFTFSNSSWRVAVIGGAFRRIAIRIRHGAAHVVAARRSRLVGGVRRAALRVCADGVFEARYARGGGAAAIAATDATSLRLLRMLEGAP